MNLLDKSAFGTKQTSILTPPMSAFGAKADLPPDKKLTESKRAGGDVFTPIAVTIVALLLW
jgi:hypothetical protein